MIQVFVIFALGILVVPTSSVGAEDASKRHDALEFKAAYGAFQTAQKQGNNVEMHEYAMEALRLGELIYGDEHQSTAALTMNAALAYPTDQYGRPGPSSLALMRKLVERYENLFGPNTAELIEPLLLLAEALAAQDFLRFDDESLAQARVRIESSEEALTRVSARLYSLVNRFDDEVDASIVLMRLSRLRVGDSEEMARSALERRRSVLGAAHPLTLSSRYFYANNFLKKSLLLNELKQLVVEDRLPPRLRFAALLQLGLIDKREPEKYAALLAQFQSGSESLSQAPIDYFPISKAQPKYPRKALNKGESGYVIVEFTVTELGSVEDIFIVKACVFNNKRKCLNRKTFNKSALAAAEKFRFIPRFVGGYPTRSVGVQNKITYELW